MPGFSIDQALMHNLIVHRIESESFHSLHKPTELADPNNHALGSRGTAAAFTVAGAATAKTLKRSIDENIIIAAVMQWHSRRKIIHQTAKQPQPQPRWLRMFFYFTFFSFVWVPLQYTQFEANVWIC